MLRWPDDLISGIRALGLADIKRVAIQSQGVTKLPGLISTVTKVLHDQGYKDPQVFALVNTHTTRLCPDEPQAAHYQADCLICIGPTCGCRCLKIPLLLYPGPDKETKNVTESLLSSLRRADPLVALLDHDETVDIEAVTAVIDKRDDVYLMALRDGVVKPLLSETVARFNHWADNTDCKGDLVLARQPDDPSPLLKLWLQRWYGCFSKIPNMTGLSVQRFSISQKSFTRVGLLMSQQLAPEVDALRRLLKKLLRLHKKVVIQISCGAITQPKLENFVDCDIFTYVGCPVETLTLLEGHREQRRKILTPVEVAISLGVVEWSSHFVVDVKEVADILSSAIDACAEPDDMSASLATLPEGALVVSGGNALLSIKDHTFRGVEGGEQSEDFTIAEGRHGVASCYTTTTASCPDKCC